MGALIGNLLALGAHKPFFTLDSEWSQAQETAQESAVKSLRATWLSQLSAGHTASAGYTKPELDKAERELRRLRRIGNKRRAEMGGMPKSEEVWP